MTSRRLFFTGCWAAVIAAAQSTIKGPLGEQPVATLKGTITGFTSKIVSVKMDDENILDFHLTRKTKYYSAGKPANSKILKVGETVTVESIRAGDGSLDAVNIKK